jgi:two-component system sensor kinase FixL
MTPIDIQKDCAESEFRELIEPLIRGQVERLEYTTRHRRSDGSSYEVDVHLQPARYRERPVLVAIVLDITRRRDAERAVEKEREAMQSKLEQLVEARTRELQMAQDELIRNEKYSTLGRVSGGIAHEIRNPLNAVKTSAYYLLNAKNPSPEKVREHLERIDRQVTLIDNAVTALSDVAKLPDANLKPVDLEPILRSVVDSVALPPEIKVTFEFPDELPQARIDQNQIVIGFRNLIRNAREAIPEAGTIRVAAVTYDDRIEVSVSDTGTGIPAELMEQVLEPLFTTKARGMGLGLSITKAIVEKNRGILSVESDVGRGSCFRFSLPRA